MGGSELVNCIDSVQFRFKGVLVRIYNIHLTCNTQGISLFACHLTPILCISGSLGSKQNWVPRRSCEETGNPVNVANVLECCKCGNLRVVLNDLNIKCHFW